MKTSSSCALQNPDGEHLVILIALDWPRQMWYTDLVRLLADAIPTMLKGNLYLPRSIIEIGRLTSLGVSLGASTPGVSLRGEFSPSCSWA